MFIHFRYKKAFRLGNPKLTLCSGSALREVKLKTSEPLLVASLKTLFYALSLWNDYSFLNVGVSVCIYHCTKKLGCILFKPAGPGEAWNTLCAMAEGTRVPVCSLPFTGTFCELRNEVKISGRGVIPLLLKQAPKNVFLLWQQRKLWLTSSDIWLFNLWGKLGCPVMLCWAQPTAEGGAGNSSHPTAPPSTPAPGLAASPEHFIPPETPGDVSSSGTASQQMPVLLQMPGSAWLCCEMQQHAWSWQPVVHPFPSPSLQVWRRRKARGGLRSAAISSLYLWLCS